MVRIRFTILEKVSRWELPSSSFRSRQDRACSDASPPSGIRGSSSDSASHLHCSSLRVAPSDRVSGRTDSSGGLSCESTHPGDFIRPASGRTLAGPATSSRSLIAPASGRSLSAPATFSSRGMLAPASGRSLSAPATSSRSLIAPASGRSLTAPATSSRSLSAPASGRGLISPATSSSRGSMAPASGRSLSAPATSSRSLAQAPASGRSLSAPATSSRSFIAPASGRGIIAPATPSSRGSMAPASGRSLSAPATSSRSLIAPASGRSLIAPATSSSSSSIAPASGRSLTATTTRSRSLEAPASRSRSHEAPASRSRSHEAPSSRSRSHEAPATTSSSHKAPPTTSRSHETTATISGSHEAPETSSGSHEALEDPTKSSDCHCTDTDTFFVDQTSISADVADEKKIVFRDVLNEVLTSYNAALEGGAEFDRHLQLYTPCDCKKCDCEQSNCSCNPCSNVWFNWRLAEQLAPKPALVHIFKESALREMLYDSELTVSVAVQIFNIPLPTLANLVEIEMLLIQLSNEFEFTLIDTQFGNGLNMSRLGGGGKRPKKYVGRKPKRRKIAIAADNENNVFLIDKSDPSHLVRVGEAGNESDSADSIVLNEADLIKENTENSDLKDSDSETMPNDLDAETPQSKRAERQRKFFGSLKGKAVLKRYHSKKKGKASLKKALDKYIQDPKGKAAVKKAQDKYFHKPEGKAAVKKAQDKYSQNPEGKAAVKKAQDKYFQKPEGKAAAKAAHDKYVQKPEGKAAAKAAHDKYVQKPEGKAAVKAAQDKYVQKPEGKAAKKKANENYANSEHGRLVKEAANQAYLERVKDKRIPRKRADSIRKKYMKRYMRYYRECDKIVVDFSQENIPGNTKALQEHVVRPELIKKFQYQGNEVLKCRSLTTAPTRYCAGNMRNAAAYYKLKLGAQLSSSMGNISDKSWETIPGVTKKALKRFIHFKPEIRASKLLTNLTWLKRKQCVDALKMFHLRLSSFADAVISKMSTQEKESDQKAALLGLQCHKKMSEPYHHKVSYVDGIPYNYKAEDQKFEEAKKSNKKNPSHLIYKCNDGCVIPDTNEDLIKLRTLFDDCKNLCESNTSGFRKYLENFQLCTKWEEYDDSVKSDLNPNRMYLFPVKHRNHPEMCYHP